MTDIPPLDDDDQWIDPERPRGLMRDLLAARERTAQVRKQNARLREVMLTRDVIERAKGILVERYTVSDSQAFGLLQAESSRGHVRVRDVAIHLTLTGTLRRPEN